MKVKFSSISGPCKLLFFAAVISTIWLNFDQKSLIGEGLVNFRLQIVVCATIGSLGWRKLLPISILAAGVIVMMQWNEVEKVRAYFATELKSYRTDSSNKSNYKLLSANILGKTNSPARVNKLVTAENADIVILQEFNQRFKDLPALAQYPYKIEKFSDDDFGMAIFSRFELIDRNKSFKQKIPLNLNAQVVTSDGTFELIAVHLVPPSSSENKQYRDLQLEEIISYANDVNSPILLAGDFNLTPFAPKYHDFAGRLGLFDARSKLGLFPSWPAFMPVFWIPIDHVFFGKGLSISDIRRGSFIWSDHFPIVVQFFFL